MAGPLNKYWAQYEYKLCHPTHEVYEYEGYGPACARCWHLQPLAARELLQYLRFPCMVPMTLMELMEGHKIKWGGV